MPNYGMQRIPSFDPFEDKIDRILGQGDDSGDMIRDPSASSLNFFVPEPTPLADFCTRDRDQACSQNTLHSFSDATIVSSSSTQQGHLQNTPQSVSDHSIVSSSSMQHGCDEGSKQLFSSSMDHSTISPQTTSIHVPLTKPKRSLSAYNLFFQEERKNLLREQKEADGGKKARGIGFADMARLIARKWKTLDKSRKAQYQLEADKDSARYEREVAIWKQRETQREIAEWKRSQQAKGMATKTPTSVHDLQSMRGGCQRIAIHRHHEWTRPNRSSQPNLSNAMLEHTDEFQPLPFRSEGRMLEKQSMRADPLQVDYSVTRGLPPGLPRSAALSNAHIVSSSPTPRMIMSEVSPVRTPLQKEYPLSSSKIASLSSDHGTKQTLQNQQQEEELLQNAWETLKMSMSL